MSLNFDNSPQAIHYFILCIAAILGAIQITAARNRRGDLAWFDALPSSILGAGMIIAGFVWFFWVDEEIFIPGLAGAEIIVVFLAAFATAVPVTRGVGFLARWITSFPTHRREQDPSQ